MDEKIEEALHTIPADLPRSEWVRVLMGLKTEGGDDAKELDQRWSERGEGYDAAAFDSTWRSIKATGGVGIGTVFGLAKQHGW